MELIANRLVHNTMKRTFILIGGFIFLLFYYSPTLMAQKQNNVEKLFKAISRNEKEKYEKVRKDLDEVTKNAFYVEVEFADCLYNILLKRSLTNCEKYYEYCVKAGSEQVMPRLNLLCAEAQTNHQALKERADDVLYKLLGNSDSTDYYAKVMLSSIKKYKYEISPEYINSINKIKEEAQYNDLVRGASPVKCETFIREYPTSDKRAAVAKIYDELLYRNAKKGPGLKGYIEYFTNPFLGKLFTSPEERMYFQQVTIDYDNALYNEAIQNKHIEQYITDNAISQEKKTFLSIAKSKYDEELYSRIKLDSLNANLDTLTRAVASYIHCKYLDPQDLKHLNNVIKDLDSYLYARLTKYPTTANINIYLYNDLVSTDKKLHFGEIEYKRDSIDYDILAKQVTSTSGLPLIKKYLEQHIYKEYKDKAIDIRNKFIVDIKKTDSLYTYVHNYQDGRLKSEERYNKNRALEYVANYKYGVKGELTEINTFANFEGKLLSKTVFKYNPIGKLIEKRQLDEGGRLLILNRYKYNSKGELTEDNRYVTPNNKYAKMNVFYPKTRITTYEYNKYSYMINECYDTYCKDKAIVEYDVYGNVIKIIRDSEGQKEEGTRKYEYDTAGMWIKSTYTGAKVWTRDEMSRTESQLNEVRSITYK